MQTLVKEEGPTILSYPTKPELKQWTQAEIQNTGKYLANELARMNQEDPLVLRACVALKDRELVAHGLDPKTNIAISDITFVFRLDHGNSPHSTTSCNMSISEKSGIWHFCFTSLGFMLVNKERMEVAKITPGVMSDFIAQNLNGKIPVEGLMLIPGMCREIASGLV